MSAPLTRRQVLRGAAGAAVGAGALSAGPLLGTAARAAGKRDRVAIVGAGAGGIAAAYFLDGTYDVDIYEGRTRIGGHCDSRWVDVGGDQVVVDLAAQFFHPDTHPIYVTLLEQLGLFDRSDPNGLQTRKSVGSLTIFPTDGGAPRFTSTHPLDDLPTALAFASFTQQARSAVIDGLAWEVTVEEWIASLPLDAAFKADVLYPWITATIGCSRADAARVSARSILQTFALSFPEDPAAGASTFSSRIGLQGNLQRLLAESRVRRVRRNSLVTSLGYGRDGWRVATPNGTKGGYRYLVMNAPRTSRGLLKRLPHFAKVAAVLREYRYFSSRLLVHRDPAYVLDPPAGPPTTPGSPGASARKRLDGSADRPAALGHADRPLQSWAQRRSADPRRIVFQREFKHPLITPEASPPPTKLQRWQGRHGLYFSGAFTTGSDLQETALMKVAEEIAPGSRNLRSLRSACEPTASANTPTTCRAAARGAPNPAPEAKRHPLGGCRVALLLPSPRAGWTPLRRW